MRALAYKEAYNVEVIEVDEPKIEAPTDGIVQITSAAICGSDLHMYDGRTTMDSGHVLGHEIMGVIAEVGEAVQELKKGDRVVLPFNIACGKCFNCVRGYTNTCLFANPDGFTAGYGYVGMGPYQGGQAEMVRVPFVDFNALKLPGQPRDEYEDDFLMLADIFPTGYHAAELAHVQPGMTVAIFGAGPVGLLTLMSAQIKGASEIYVIDNIESRLVKVTELGGIPINFSDGDPVEQIQHIRKQNQLLQASFRPGEEKMSGVMCGIDAVGYQARDRHNPSQEKATQVLDDLARLVNPTGSIGIIGVFMDADPGASDSAAKQGVYPLPIGTIWNKGISIGTGQCPVKKYNYQLRDLVLAGKANPGTIITHHLTFDEVPEFYARFDTREEGVIKGVINP